MPERRNDFDPLGNLLIFSDPRGGSTWIMEMIALLERTAILWEPLHIQQVPAFQELGFAWRQHVPRGGVWPEAEGLFVRLNRGKLLNEWICQQTTFDSLRTAERLVVKICRGNALLPWLTDRFKFRFAPLYLVRHPFAVVASQLRQGGWDYTFTGFTVPPEPFNEIYRTHERYLRTLRTKEEARTAMWCITNLVPLRSPGNGREWITVYYEDLLLDPETEIRRVFSRWGIATPADIADRVREASSTTKEATFRAGAEKQLAKWKKSFSDDQLARMLDVLSYFEVEEYGDGILPRCGRSRSPGAVLGQ